MENLIKILDLEGSLVKLNLPFERNINTVNTSKSEVTSLCYILNDYELYLEPSNLKGFNWKDKKLTHTAECCSIRVCSKSFDTSKSVVRAVVEEIAEKYNIQTCYSKSNSTIFACEETGGLGYYSKEISSLRELVNSINQINKAYLKLKQF